ncbi:uracil-DNA glycosylase family protein [Neptuniibacter marinus]|uniref:uracil-DNA glycosylase family protein n=1 Tax=Neptuniibacter marinus TaxID=1806670 RepID=UPI003B5C014C
MSHSFSQHTPTVQSLPIGRIEELPESLKIASDNRLSCYYAPFDYINTNARIVICGITPGFQQARIALEVAAESLRTGSSELDSLRAAKATASFAGSMRKNLIRMLDYCGVNEKLELSSCSELFEAKRELLHTTSALRYPVFVNGKNYSGSPSMLRTPLLRDQIETYLVPEIASINPSALYVPLGEKVAEVLLDLAKRGVIREEQVLAGMPHPSGANAERIKFFLGEKDEKDLSEKTNPVVINQAKALLLQKLAA